MRHLFQSSAILALVCALAWVGVPEPAQADTASFIAATCGTPCADPSGELAADTANWNSLSAMGTTQYIGAQFNGSTIDASALLAAARVAGPTVLDTYLTTGVAPDQATETAILTALAITGIDVSGITGVVPTQSTLTTTPATTTASSTSNTTLTGILQQFSSPTAAGSSSLVSGIAQSMLSGATGGSPANAFSSGDVACNSSFSSALASSAQQAVTNMQTVATSGDYGFSQLGGSAISSGQRSSGGYVNASCLTNLMQGNRDLLMRPPQLGQLISALSSMFGGGSGSCSGAPSVLTQITGSLTGAMFSANGGGFNPHLGFGTDPETGAVLSAAQSLINSIGVTAATTTSAATVTTNSGLASIFPR